LADAEDKAATVHQERTEKKEGHEKKSKKEKKKEKKKESKQQKKNPRGVNEKTTTDGLTWQEHKALRLAQEKENEKGRNPNLIESTPSREEEALLAIVTWLMEVGPSEWHDIGAAGHHTPHPFLISIQPPHGSMPHRLTLVRICSILGTSLTPDPSLAAWVRETHRGGFHFRFSRNT